MANFVLDETAGNINTAINKVLNADSAPTVTNALITSQGVKTYVDSAVSALSTRLTSAEATITAMQNASIGTIVYTAVSGYTTNSSNAIEWNDAALGSNQIGSSISSDNKTITLGAGRYIIDINGPIREVSDNNSGDYWTVALEQDGSAITPSVSVNDTYVTVAISVGTVVTQGTSGFRFEATEIPNAGEFRTGLSGLPLQWLLQNS